MKRLLLALLLTCLTALPGFAQALVGDDAPLRFGRFEADGEVHYGFLGAGGIHQLTGSFLDPDTRMTGKAYDPAAVRLLAPVEPGKVIGIAFNYPVPDAPKRTEMAFFAKLPNAVIGPGDAIVPPPGSTSLHYEGEMVIVIGLKTRNVAPRDALSHVFGVTIGNDVTEHGFGTSAFDVLKAKGADTLAPLGPWIVPGLAYDKLKLETRLNGEVVQAASTSEMIRSTAEIIAEISRYITLEPGDVIYTGTPGKTAAMKPGDVVEVTLEGVGTLSNTVAAPVR